VYADPQPSVSCVCGLCWLATVLEKMTIDEQYVQYRGCACALQTRHRLHSCLDEFFYFLCYTYILHKSQMNILRCSNIFLALLTIQIWMVATSSVYFQSMGSR
jgi:hypothetical protein